MRQRSWFDENGLRHNPIVTVRVNSATLSIDGNTAIPATVGRDYTGRLLTEATELIS